MLKTISDFSQNLNDLVWGVPMLILLIGTGIFLSIRLGFLQFTKFGFIMKHTVGKLFEKKENKEGSLTPVQALTTALAGTVGTGNIAGVAGAIALGGPGAIFWMWLAALFGMCTKYSEIILAIHFRKKNEQGDYIGGPMYYIEKGLGRHWKWLAVMFAFFGMFASIGTGNMTQINTIATSIGSVVTSFHFSVSQTDLSRIYLAIGLIGAFLTLLVLFGGLQRIGSVTEKLVPVMALVYIVTALAVVLTHVNMLGDVFVQIFKGAFDPQAISGGLAGIGIMGAMKSGFGRGIFSNEAGLGTAPIAHAAADVDHPVDQGMYGVFEVFTDTIVICSLTAFAILISGCAPAFYGKAAGTNLTVQAFATTFGDKAASIIIAVCITMFAFSTLLSWALYGGRCAEYLFGTRFMKIYQCFYVIMVIVGACVKLSLAWQIADSMNALMAIPNLIGILLLSPTVVRLTKDYFAENGN